MRRSFTFGSIKLGRFGLGWGFVGSIVIHIALLWQFQAMIRYSGPLVSEFVVAQLWSEPERSSSSAPRGGGGSSSRNSVQNRASRTSNRPAAPTAALTEGTSAAQDTGIVTSAEGIGTGGIAGSTGAGSGSSSGEIGSSDRGIGKGDDSGSATKGEKSKGLGAGPSIAERTAIVIPPALQRTTSPYESEVYAEADFYTLFTEDFRVSLNVPANRVCLDGNIIRTLERQVLSHTVTDISKCRYDNMGDDQEKMRCPADAHTKIVSYNNYLSSPVSYNLNICLVYDRSNCTMIYPDDGPEREVCRPTTKYEGIWAAGTQFHYQCSKSTVQTFTQPLEYEVRFIQDIEFPDTRVRRRLVQREKRPLARCD